MSFCLGWFSLRSVASCCPHWVLMVMARNLWSSRGEPQWGGRALTQIFSVVHRRWRENEAAKVAMHFGADARCVFWRANDKSKSEPSPPPLQIVAFRSTKEMRQMAPLFSWQNPQPLAGLFPGRRGPLLHHGL